MSIGISIFERLLGNFRKQPMMRTHYDNLQVLRTADEAVIRAAYRTLSQKHHPDKNPENREKAELVMRIINEAYKVLSDPALRGEHDQWIARQEEEKVDEQQHPLEQDSKSPAEQRTNPTGDHDETVLRSQVRPPPSNAGSGVLGKHAGKGFFVLFVGLASLILIGFLSDYKNPAVTWLLFPLLAVAMVTLTTGPIIILYACYAAIRKKSLEESFGTWAKPMMDLFVGAIIVTTCIYYALEWLNKL